MTKEMTLGNILNDWRDDRAEIQKQCLELGLQLNKLKQQNAALVETLEEVEWEMVQDGWTRECPWCLEEESKGHADNCSRQKALALVKGTDLIKDKE